MTEDAILIRPAAREDLPALGVLGAQLVELHNALDGRRFMRPVGDVAHGYAHFLGSQLRNPDAVVVVAADGSTVCGYVFATIEPRSWESLRDEAGFVHDLIVAEGMRRRGVATRLMDAAFEWLQSRGMPRVLLDTAYGNGEAQRLFARLGFRPTMIEMTRELG